MSRSQKHCYSRCDLNKRNGRRVCRTGRDRGVAKADKHGAMKVLLDDYPYAEDGLLIWNALKKWNDSYLVRQKP